MLSLTEPQKRTGSWLTTAICQTHDYQLHCMNNTEVKKNQSDTSCELDKAGIYHTFLSILNLQVILFYFVVTPAKHQMSFLCIFDGPKSKQ